MVVNVRGLPQLSRQWAGPPFSLLSHFRERAWTKGHSVVYSWGRKTLDFRPGIHDGQHVASSRLLLLLDITLENVAGGTAATGSEIGRRPQHVLPDRSCRSMRLETPLSELTSSILHDEDSAS